MSTPIGPTSLDLPAWVQAVGSVAAILLGIYFSRRDSRLRRADDLERRMLFIRYLLNCVNVLTDQISRARAIAGSLESGQLLKSANHHIEKVQFLIDRLERLPLASFPDLVSLNSHSGLIEHSTNILVGLGKLAEGPDSEADDEFIERTLFYIDHDIYILGNIENHIITHNKELMDERRAFRRSARWLIAVRKSRNSIEAWWGRLRKRRHLRKA